MKIKYFLPIAVLVASTLNAQEPHKRTPNKASVWRAKIYNRTLATYDKALTKIEGIISKKDVCKKSLKKAIKELEMQEKKLISFRYGRSVYQPQFEKEAVVIDVRDPELALEDDPIEHLVLGILPTILEYVVNNDYPEGANKNYVIGRVNSQKETVALKQKELKEAYNL